MDLRPHPRDLLDPRFVEERLKAITSQLIAARKRQDHSLVVPYARQAGLPVDGQSPQRLFMRAIQIFHPDRLSVFRERIDKAQKEPQGLEALCRLLELRSPSPARAPRFFEESDPEEESFYDPEDPGFAEAPASDEPSWDSEDEGDEGDDWDPDEGTFYSAVKRALFGNLDLYPGPADLARLEGELDLSDWDLHDLEGIEYCRGLSSLNLSLNNLDNLYPLKDLVKLEVLDVADNDLEDADWLAGLVNLRELDLSGNDIDDVAFLDRLPRLRYVDLTGNPVRNRAVLARLEARGVIVIL